MSKLSFPKIMTGCFHFMPHTLVKKHTFTKESTTPQKPHREALNEEMIMSRIGCISLIKTHIHEFVVAEDFVKPF